LESVLLGFFLSSLQQQVTKASRKRNGKLQSEP